MRITLYYDVVSPYSWLAFEVLHRYQTLWKIPITYQPFLLAGIMKLSRNSPPASNPIKAVYLERDIERNKSFFGIPLAFPSNFPVSTLKAQRALTAIQRDFPVKLVDCSRSLWVGLWQQDQDVSKWSIVKACLDPHLTGDYLNQLEEIIETTEIKDRLLHVTETCVVEMGCFGAPWIHVQLEDGSEEFFFGSDRFEAMASILKKPWYGPQPQLSKM